MPNLLVMKRMGIPVAICWMISLGGCAVFYSHVKTGTPDDAFITYWRPPAGTSGRVRLAVKDLIDVRGVVSTAGSEYISKHNVPAARDAECLKGARELNALLVGKTNLSELAVAPSGLNGYFGTPRNPLDRKIKLIPGGSSSGSAVAVADGLADVAYGTDTAGSIRVPAACCGAVGLKTTFGLISLKGVFPIEPRYLDTIGPMGKDIAHTVTGMNLLKPGFAREYEEAVRARPLAREIRIGRLYINRTDPKIDEAVDESLRKAGFKVVRLDDAFRAAWVQAEADGTAVAAGGAWLNDHFWMGKPGITARTTAVLALGAITYDTTYGSALSRQAQWKRALRRVFRHVDFVALPTLNGLPPRVPPFLGSPLFETRILGLENTVAVNFAGNPALAVPIPVQDKRIPLTSLQLIGLPLHEAELLNAGRLVEASPCGTRSNLQ